MRPFFIFIFLHFFLISAHSAGLISIKGEIKTCAQYDCQIKVGGQVYTIELPQLTKKQQTTLKNKRPGDEMNEFIPMAAIKDVKDIK
jgi:hypothetical protein